MKRNLACKLHNAYKVNYQRMEEIAGLVAEEIDALA